MMARGALLPPAGGAAGGGAGRAGRAGSRARRAGLAALGLAFLAAGAFFVATLAGGAGPGLLEREAEVARREVALARREREVEARAAAAEASGGGDRTGGSASGGMLGPHDSGRGSSTEGGGGAGDGGGAGGGGGSGITARELPDSLPSGASGNSFLRTDSRQVLSWMPMTYVIPNFLTEAECDKFIEVARRSMTPSGLALRPGENMDEQTNVRTSSGTFVSSNSDPLIQEVEQRIHDAVGVHRSHGESFNVLRYELGQHYFSHHDYFDSGYGNSPNTNRLLTVLLYLSDVEEGGETVLPLEGEGGMERLSQPKIYENCDIGLKVPPRKGQALVFYSLKPNGDFDPQSLHGGCPVVKGEKWVATKWIRQNCQISPCLPPGEPQEKTPPP